MTLLRDFVCCVFLIMLFPSHSKVSFSSLLQNVKQRFAATPFGFIQGSISPPKKEKRKISVNFRALFPICNRFVFRKKKYCTYLWIEHLLQIRSVNLLQGATPRLRQHEEVFLGHNFLNLDQPQIQAVL